MQFALLFPGQGSQSVGMLDAFQGDSVVRETFDSAKRVLGLDLWELAMRGPEEEIGRTEVTQPLMLTSGVALYRHWAAAGGPAPSVAAGHSLGEYSALVAAGCLRFEDALPLVRERALAMQEAVPRGVGAMAAILGLEAAEVVSICARAAQQERVEAVNFNEPRQTVIAGHVEAVERAMAAALDGGAKRAVRLSVSAPFHSSLLRPASIRLANALAKIELARPNICVINNVDVESPVEPAAIVDALIRQAAAPVRWVETMQAIEQAGVKLVAECGPGKVLTGLVKRCAKGIGVLSLASPEEVKKSIQALSGL